MSMSDEILIADAEDAKRFLNSAGTPMYMQELNTKSLDCAMVRYVLHSSRLWLRERSSEPNEEYIIENGSLIAKCKLTPVTDITANIHAYCSDYLSPPILSFDLISTYDTVRARYLSCEWNIEVRNGIVAMVIPFKIETRNGALGELMGRFGEVIIDDNHPIAKSYMARLGKGRRGII